MRLLFEAAGPDGNATDATAHSTARVLVNDARSTLPGFSLRFQKQILLDSTTF